MQWNEEGSVDRAVFPTGTKNETTVIYIALLLCLLITLFYLEFFRMTVLQKLPHWYLLPEWNPYCAWKDFPFQWEIVLKWVIFPTQEILQEIWWLNFALLWRILLSQWKHLGCDLPHRISWCFDFSLLIKMKGLHTFIGRWEVRNSLNLAPTNRNWKELESDSSYLNLYSKVK